jgi:hypothetical protein
VKVALALLCTARLAYADKAAADLAFAEAKRLVAAGKIAEACPKFELSYNEDPQLGALLNLADCHEQIGKLATALAEFHAGGELAHARRDAREKFVADRVAKLAKRVSHVAIKRADPGTSIAIDGRDVTAIADIEIPVDPGKHVLAASAPGRTPWTSAFEIERDSSRVPIDVPALAVAPVAVVTPPPPPIIVVTVPPPLPPRANWHTPAIAIGAAGLVVAGVGLYFGHRASSDWNASRSLCPGDICNADGKTLVDSAQSAALKSDILVGIGAAGLATAAFLWLAGPTEHRVTVGATATSVGAAFTTAF